MLKKFMEYCKCSHSFLFDDSFSIYELVIKCIEKINEIIDFVNGFESELNKKEDSDNITNNRKLSENGDFTGTWFNDTKSNMDMKIAEGLNNYNTLLDFLKANPQYNYIVWDGKFFTTIEPPDTPLDGGSFTEADTEETDAGLFIYPCQCIN